MFCCLPSALHCLHQHLHFVHLQLDNMQPGGSDPTIIEIQDALYEVTGARSVPRVFVGGEFIGGGDDTAAKAASGELAAKLKAIGL
jgi:hypothetical protein